MSLILASQSPRRQQLLSQMGLSFAVRVADIDETMDPALSPEDGVREISGKKACAIPAAEDDVVIAADTIVVVDGSILGKPHTPEEAMQMLRRLSGREHRVMTGLTVKKGEHCESCTEVTTIRFRTLSDTEIGAYVATGDPMDKAGSYGIQGLAAIFAQSIQGDYFNVMGLPLCTLCRMLRRFGVTVLGEKG